MQSDPAILSALVLHAAMFCYCCVILLAARTELPCREDRVACNTCGKHVHTQCMREWLANRNKEQKMACVLCRSPWTDDQGEEMTKYLNLLSPGSAVPNLNQLYGDNARWIR
jgi:hypothetical protein